MTSATATLPLVHVVDDDASVRSALMRMLRIAGFEARGYESAASFLAGGDDAGGCLLLDVSLPGMSGVELQAVLARVDDCLPIVFLTGHGDIAMGVRAMKAGAVDFLTKPVKRDVLLATMTALPPVVFITAFDTPEARAQALEAGAVAFLTKPFSGRTLIDTVRQALDPTATEAA